MESAAAAVSLPRRFGQSSTAPVKSIRARLLENYDWPTQPLYGIRPGYRYTEFVLGTVTTAQLDIVRRLLGDFNRDWQHARILVLQIGHELDRTEELQGKDFPL